MEVRISLQERIAKILGDYEDLSHPFASDFKVSKAISIVLGVLSLSFSESSCKNMQDVLQGLRDAHPGHTWITGEYATQVVKMTLAKRAGYEAAAAQRRRNPKADRAYVALFDKHSADVDESSPLSLARVWKEGFDKFVNEKAVAST